MQPPAGPVPARIGLGRSNAVGTIALLAFLMLIVCASTVGGFTAPNLSSRILCLALAAVFAVPLLVLAVLLRVLIAPRYVIVDGFGLAIAHGTSTVVVAWPDIAAYGIGYAFAEPEKVKIPVTVGAATDMLSERLAGVAAEALEVSQQRQVALEIFPTGLDAVNRYPRLKPYWKELPPPSAGLAPMRWQFPLPPVIPIAQQIANALFAWSPPRWTGWFPVSWRGKK
jgi:hypothetical protein